MTGDEGALDPDDLDFTDDERVRKLEEGRYVVSAEGSPNVDAVDGIANTDRDDSEGQPDHPPDAVTHAQVSRWLAGSFEDTGFTYGFDATLAVEDEVVRHRLVSNDLPTTFETLVTWFIQNSTANATTEEALGILLDASDLRVTYPTASLRHTMNAHGLGPNDTIGEFLAAIEADGGIHFDSSNHR